MPQIHRFLESAKQTLCVTYVAQCYALLSFPFSANGMQLSERMRIGWKRGAHRGLIGCLAIGFVLFFPFFTINASRCPPNVNDLHNSQKNHHTYYCDSSWTHSNSSSSKCGSFDSGSHSDGFGGGDGSCS
ncbi:hypothetical protein GTNG_1566 [Geobacillus thermodenitrificans NG80-2]|uniref:Uncharacterized protein n=1 Tax=Geobacillus thermodenitrificans (strain NG80-2) TaxID=420246 RepID=A4INN0_GEOTN|nr:hypothetical protein GTNG_1566 [Geobacillus thermodenitrificans NG80-2]